MSWVGISDGQRTIIAPPPIPDNAADLLSTGTLVVEVVFVAQKNHRQTVIDLDRNSQWPRLFRMSLGETGDIYVEHRQGESIVAAMLTFDRPEPEETLRIALSWHAPERLGILSVENLDTGSLNQTLIDDPNPWPQDDVATLIRGGDGCRIDPTITLLAVSDRVEPVGLASGFAAGTVIDTAAGPCRVEDLQPGDLVVTADCGLQPVRSVASQEVPAYGRFAPVCLHAPFFGLRRDLTVAPDHRLLIAGADAEYLFGADTVLVKARHLARLAARPRARRPRTLRYVQVLMDAHVCLSVSGAWGESLYLGDLADHALRHATSALAAVPAADLPRHTRVASQQLQSYEAMVLMSAMCA